MGIVSSIQTHGSLANWHRHLHMLVTDGGFRPDGTFVRLPLHDVATLTEAFRRAVLRLFVRRELLDSDTAAGMLAWPHSGFHVHDGVSVPADDRGFTVRLARYCARKPIALGRLAYQEHDNSVTYHSDKPAGPTAGAETTDVLEFLARVVSHIPDKGQVLQRYYGWYASRVRGRRRKGLDADSERPLVCVKPLPEAVHGARRRWAELLRRIFEVAPLACPRCGQQDAHHGVHHTPEGHRRHPRSPRADGPHRVPFPRSPRALEDHPRQRAGLSAL
ncbi:MAG: transposase [Gemmatimonadota bacterium]